MADMKGNRPAVIQKLLRVQRELDAEAAYAQAFDEWERSGEDAIWDGTAGDGLSE